MGQFPYLNDNKTTLTFDGKSSFHDGNWEFLVDNNEKGSLKSLNVYGLNNQDTIKTSSSYLVDAIHKLNTDARLVIYPSTNATTDVKQYNIKIPKLQYPGSYEGWIFIEGKDNIPIPVTIATEPKVVVALVWVIIGILTSILFWELINYVNQVKEAEIKHQTNNVNASILVKNELHDYLNRRLISKAFIKVSIIDIGTIGFGIAVGFLALLSQGYVIAIRVIEPIDILALIGLGLGIGSLREFLNKDS